MPYPLTTAAALLVSMATLSLSRADETAAFKAAGFTLKGGQWRSACDDPGTASYRSGVIAVVHDFNGDGFFDAVVTESSSHCYGNAGTGFTLVSKQAGGKWIRVTSGTGTPEFLLDGQAGSWPDIVIGGPGFCFPVQRWNGRSYAVHRHQYQGKPCRPPR